MKNYIDSFFIILYLVIGYVGTFGAADEIASQWLYLSIINTLSFLFLLYLKQPLSIKSFDNLSIKLFGLLIILSSFSILVSLNKTETIVALTKWIMVFISLVFLTVHLKNSKINFKTVSIILTIFLSYEIFRSITPYFQIIEITDFSFSFSSALMGVTGNKNITAASILIKVPFCFFLYRNSKTNLSRILLFFILSIATYNVLLLSSRAMIIALTLILSLIIVYNLKTKNSVKNILKSVALDLSPFLLSLLIFSIIYSNDETFSLDQRMSKINTSDESTNQRLRFYMHGIKHTMSNPFIGVGLGNWKVKSIDYDSENIISYIVPYHLHNDFLELGAELGILGMLIYILIFINPVSIIIRLIKNNPKSLSYYIILMSGCVFFVDSNLNFPMHRPIVLMFFIFLLVLTENLKNTKVL